jgi:hypothetical protein
MWWAIHPFDHCRHSIYFHFVAKRKGKGGMDGHTQMMELLPAIFLDFSCLGPSACLDFSLGLSGSKNHHHQDKSKTKQQQN